MKIPKAVRSAARRVGLRRPARRLRLPDVDFQSGLGGGAWLLHGLVHALEPAVVVEIGSARGQSACYIGLALKQLGRGRLYAIDPHTATAWNDADSVETYRAMRRNLRAFGVERYVQIVRDYSTAAGAQWHEPIDLLFIDGDHSYEGVKRDWELFAPHVREFGTVVFHDTLWSRVGSTGWHRDDMGVPRFVDELRRDGYPVVTFDRHFGISLVQATRGGIPLEPR